MLRKNDIDEKMVPMDLKGVFSRLHDHLYAQSNISRNERLGKELMKIILAKYFDEKERSGIFPKGSMDLQKSTFPPRLRGYFSDVLSPRLVETGVFAREQTIDLDNDSLVVVGQLLKGMDLLGAPQDALGAAFEVFAEGNLAGDQGQFFTPLGIVQMAVEMVAPGPSTRLIDPACGSGGFLNVASRWVSERCVEKKELDRFLHGNVFGLDKDLDLVEIARGIGLVSGRNPNNIYLMDSLGLLREDPEGLLGSFDLVLTNPPFGSKIKIKDRSLLDMFELGHAWTYDDKIKRWSRTERVQDRVPQILFIELCMRLLNEGGTCALVLPDGIFGNPTEGWVRQYIMDNAKLLAVVDCPHDTFMPATHTKTSVLFFQRTRRPVTDHSIFMSIVDRCGHDSRGTPITDPRGKVLEDFSTVARRYHDRKAWGKDRLGFAVSMKDLVGTIFVPRYYDIELREGIKGLERSGRYMLLRLKDLEGSGAIEVRNAPPTASKLAYGSGNIPFIRTSDIGNGEVLQPTTHSVSTEVYEAFRDKQGLMPNDILMIKDGTYRVGRSVLLLKEDIECLVQSHFKIITVHDNELMDPFLLYHLLQRPIVMRQIELNTFVQATLSTVGDRFADVILPIPKDRKERASISAWVEKVLRERRRLLMELQRMGRDGGTDEHLR